MAKEYPCHLSSTGRCKYGGYKTYNYGFVSGAESYCRKAKKWVYPPTVLHTHLEKCPKQERSDGKEAYL